MSALPCGCPQGSRYITGSERHNSCDHTYVPPVNLVTIPRDGIAHHSVATPMTSDVCTVHSRIPAPFSTHE
jgi:hypothetical protein